MKVEELQKMLAKERIIPHIVCMDGYWLSVQASELHYCTPRTNEGPWITVECMLAGVPHQLEGRVDEYGIAAYIPIEIIVEIINEHGGLSN